MAAESPGEAGAVPSAELASFVAGLEFGDVPEPARRLAERCFVDTVGVTFAGMAEGAGETAARGMRRASGEGPVTLLGAEGSATVTDGAFVNGTAGHGLDFDDVSNGMNGHPSVTLVAPALAVAEADGLSGEDVLTAFVAGFETECYLAAPINPAHYGAGWHATATMGTFGAAAATANLLGLREAETAHALNIAASEAAGLKVNFGTMTKPMHAGMAARSGVTAAYLASEGFTADADAIAGPKGFFDLYGGDGVVDRDASHALGEEWAVVDVGVGVKKYPCCYFTHTGITAAAELASEHDIAPEDVERVHVVASRGAGDALHHSDPATGLEGKFSMEYAVASAIARSRVGLATFEDEFVDDPAVQRVRERVDFEVDEDLRYGTHRTSVTIQTASGEFTLTLDGPPGTHEDPLSDAELAEKFRMCVTRAESATEADRLYETLDSLRDVADVRDVF